MQKRWCKILPVLLAALMLGGCSWKGQVFWEQTRPESSAAFGETEVSGSVTLEEIFSMIRDRTAAAFRNGTEMRGVWLSYLDLAPLTAGKTAESFGASAEEICAHAESFGLNTLFVQVRPFCDSFYPSEFFPWSKFAGGVLGKDPGFDPVQILREAAARHDLSFQIWINPMRGVLEEEISQIPETFAMRRWYDDPELRRKHLLLADGRMYLNPASEEARKLIADGALEAVRNYRADGLHLDDYFYPPSLAAEADICSYQDRSGRNSSLTQAEWRRENTCRMITELGHAVHAENADLLFGVSPRGVPAQNYSDVYIDVERWLSEPGLLDYLAPQIYFGFQHETAPFARMAEEWDALCARYEVPLIPGLAAYKAGSTDDFAGTGREEWLNSPDILADQMQFARKLSSYGGAIFFRYDSLFGQQISAPAAEALENLLDQPDFSITNSEN